MNQIYKEEVKDERIIVEDIKIEEEQIQEYKNSSKFNVTFSIEEMGKCAGFLPVATNNRKSQSKEKIFRFLRRGERPRANLYYDILISKFYGHVVNHHERSYHIDQSLKTTLDRTHAYFRCDHNQNGTAIAASFRNVDFQPHRELTWSINVKCQQCSGVTEEVSLNPVTVEHQEFIIRYDLENELTPTFAAISNAISKVLTVAHARCVTSVDPRREFQNMQQTLEGEILEAFRDSIPDLRSRSRSPHQNNSRLAVKNNKKRGREEFD